MKNNNGIRICSKCGFILGTRPHTGEKDGVCLACINQDNKKHVDFVGRQKWLTKFIEENKGDVEYDCLIAVSGGKDSHCIVRQLIEKHGVKNPLLVTVTDEFSHTKAGLHNINNLVSRYDLDHITFRCKPQTFKRETLKDFEQKLHPLKWIEEKIYEVPVNMAKKMGIRTVFFGENSAFEYGTSEELEIFHPASDDNVKIVFMGAIYPYSITSSLQSAREIGFKDLDDFNEWPRQGSIENYTQIDSVAYLIHLWTKFVKFGFQRVSDIACRFVREGKLSKHQAESLIKERDYICDPLAKADFCSTIGITQKHFDEIVDKHANRTLVTKDINGLWRRKDLINEAIRL
ncbi:MAG: flagellin modification protein PseA [Phycisphaerales bacterium]